GLARRADRRRGVAGDGRRVPPFVARVTHRRRGRAPDRMGLRQSRIDLAQPVAGRADLLAAREQYPTAARRDGTEDRQEGVMASIYDTWDFGYDPTGPEPGPLSEPPKPSQAPPPSAT